MEQAAKSRIVEPGISTHANSSLNVNSSREANGELNRTSRKDALPLPIVLPGRRVRLHGSSPAVSAVM
jgi:hypothetical protein